MGYYTRFQGSVTGPAELLEQFEAAANAGASLGKYNIAYSDWLSDGINNEEAFTWYTWQEDLITLSNKYPNLLFELYGEGEESGDIWKAWARNGKIILSRATLVFDEPDFDNDLPSVDVEVALAARRAEKRARLSEAIARLEAERDAIGS